ncbi:MAG: threonine--tRNA ligase [Clostridia bacterium]|nr:threonine--tRNA ligase [Clostridia bacterium]
MSSVKITLKDGSIREIERGMTIYDLAKSISGRLAKEALAGEVDGEVVDLSYSINEDSNINILRFEDEKGANVYLHTSAHILAQAVKRLYPDAKLATGPAIERGFYYDFDVKVPFKAEDIVKIEAEMKKIIKESLPIERFELSKEEAIKLMEENDEEYKIEIINELEEGEIISFYKQGDFVDLCAGPHLPNTKQVKAIKVLSTTGAYWRGDENRKMLQRIYGTAFPKQKLLDEYLHQLEEAKKRDHNKLGRELEFFTTVDAIGKGLPLLMPKGTKVIQILQRFVEDEEERRGYKLTKTPVLAKSDLYKISGHWQHYKDGMFVVGDKEDDENAVALRPMTCPFQFMIYKARQRSYRDLPIRYAETSTLFRNESSGEMHGLIRLRQFTISEGHLICTPEHLADEVRGVVDLVNFMMKTLGVHDDVTYRFSKWDENNKSKYIGNAETWEKTQDIMRNILDSLNLNYYESEGEAAFYGPKLDIQFRNVHGKEDTLITIQIDFSLAERFDMTYVDKDGEKKHPIIIHRTSIGCYERTLAMLIEKYAGAFPTWLSPVQVKVLPISEKYHEYANQVVHNLNSNNIRVEIDERSEKIGYKIREARLERIPYMLIIGEKEKDENKVAVRSRKKGDEGVQELEEFIVRIKKEVNDKILNYE